MDYPKIRRSYICPRCNEGKPMGNLVCWPCNRDLKNTHNGCYGAYFEEVLARKEAKQ